MSDRINIITVVLEKPIRDDDCEPIVNAIKMIKGVLDAEPKVAHPEEYMAIVRARNNISTKLWEVLYPPNE